MKENHNKPHFLLVGHEGSHNRGCEALVRSTIEIIREVFPTSTFTVTSMYPEHDVPLLEIDGVEIIPGVSINRDLYQSEIEMQSEISLKLKKGFYRVSKIVFPNSIVPILKFPRPTKENGFKQVRHLKKHMLSATAVISIGGDLFLEDWGTPPIYALETVEYAQFLGCKTIIWGSSIWPIKTKWLQERIRIMLENCTFVSVRDDPSFKYLSSLGIKTNLKRVSDGAFLMPPKHSDRSRVHFHSTPASLVGFNGSPLFYGLMTRSKARKVLFDIIDFFKGIIDNQNCCVVLVPHDAYPAPAERDFLFEIMQEINRPDCVYMPPIGLDGPETKALISQCNFFIGMRFHSTIAALSQSIPTLGLSYSPKFAGLHQDVYGHTDYLVSYNDVSVDVLSSKFDALKANQNNIQKSLNSRVPELQEAARRNGQYVKTLLA